MIEGRGPVAGEEVDRGKRGKKSIPMGFFSCPDSILPFLAM
jgi:hypothetical protein